MKVGINFETSDKRWIVATISVLEQGEFLSKYIFKNPADYPSYKDYEFDQHQTDTIRCHFQTAENAKQWVIHELSALRAHLRAWENTDNLVNYTTNL